MQSTYNLRNKISEYKDAFLLNRVHALLIVVIFFMALGSYAIIPFYIFYMTKNLGISSFEIGILLSVNVFAHRGLALLAGFLIDKFGSRPLMLWGVFIRIVSYVFLAFAQSFETLMIATLLSGVGVALAQTAGKTLLISREGDIAALLASRIIALNLGIILGPAVGYLLLSWSFPVICICVAIIFTLILTLLFLEIPKEAKDSLGPSAPFDLTSFFKLIFTPSVFVILLLQICFHFFYTSLELAFPIYAKDNYSVAVVGAIFVINAIVAVVFQLPAARLMKKNTPLSGIGLALVTLSFFFSALSAQTVGNLSIAFFIVAIIIFSLAEVVVMLFVDIWLAKNTESRQLGKIFGLSSFAAMIGAILGNSLFGYMLSGVESSANYSTFWLTLCISSFFVMVFFCIHDLFQFRKMRLQSN
ncbi:putative MFS family arabinose efflux permease [Advenella incenata]|uniref:Putative MFS family arabinose efflux permease n=1 Tax=Advenella incenata TaxID=267800 RepID=A0A4V2FTQ2_9BURK|nr:MFS transporter [Advenella incenata]RZT99025.1 putative MFS family arabinose efflux permease [Advenella incenata]